MKGFFLLFAVISVLFARIYWHYSHTPTFKDRDTIRITSVVRREPIRFETSQYIVFYGLKIYLPLYPEISYGDKIVVEGMVDGDRLVRPKVVSLEESNSFLYSFRKKLIGFFESTLPQPHASLISGVVIGSRQNIPSDFWESLKNSGTAHVVVASGMNITLVSGFLINFFTIFVKRRIALVFVFIGIWSYALLSGFDAPIVRAVIMGSLAFLAQELGKINVSLRILVITALVMLIVVPEYVGDLGFWLSFLATLGIVLFEGKIRKFLTKRVGGENYAIGTFKTDLSTTLAAQIMVWPILFFYFGKFNLLSPIINVLVLWTIVPITLIGMMGGLIGLAIKPVGTLVLYLSYPLTSWFIGVVMFFG